LPVVVPTVIPINLISPFGSLVKYEAEIN